MVSNRSANQNITVQQQFRFKPGDTVIIKKDKFFRDREKVAQMWNIKCTNCKSTVLLYQKDGRGQLHRCYLNRIFDPDFYAELQNNPNLTKKTMPLLICSNCSTLIGTPTLHREGRLAYLLILGTWSKEKSKVMGK